jgi:hypothetical protein
MKLTGLQPTISWMRSRAPYARAACTPAPTRYQNGYVSSGTAGYARPTGSALKRPKSSKNVPAGAREWTRGRYLSFPRNEGVPGSSAGVGLKSPA